MIDTTSGGFWGFLMLLVNVVLGGVIGAWALRRRVRDDANVNSEARAQKELTTVRGEYLKRIERLEKRLDDKDAEIRALSRELSDARVIVAQQAGRIADLEADLAQLHRQHEGRA